ncbi:uncharacterized protein SPPG_03142 [Spizellomyces punctatus DAOM BR117]|uniref:Uncharacterized protein n=1 Tax=Spizellomyces punctatus (strain DAOM BR117) TaxID=645134 RepID=A0A0L0HKG7_SPIPD|nr:uncharacterized protein SPPG_03142 [Spizellomyces punctatus DAOM BR117]KND01329.1 hypothetical protein SPPG_03142 [Spizellomyces punctatus DAOM BR117]|eukprot:XP_016609368.1 hypothetical protein SPPG_03142 [Spizellomyces punctatus DAOM BR117]
MPRRSGGGSGGRGGSAPRTSTPPAAPRNRSYSSAPPVNPSRSAPPPQQPRGDSMLGRFASTAAGVAVGSAVGHTLVSMFGGLFPRSAHDQIAQQNETLPPDQQQAVAQASLSQRLLGTATLWGVGGGAWWYRNRLLAQTRNTRAAGPRVAAVVAAGSGILGLVNLVS